MKKLNYQNQHDVRARAALRAVRLQELLFGGGVASPVGPTSGARLGTSLPLATESPVKTKWPDELGE
jgi:hypothetical protein